MGRTIWAVLGLLLLAAPATGRRVQAPPDDIKILTDFGEDFQLDRASTAGTAEVSRAHAGGVPALRMRSKNTGATLKVTAAKAWDISGHLYVRMDLFNPGPEELFAVCLINGSPTMAGAQVTPPGERRTLTALIRRTARPESIAKIVFGMDGLPGGYVGSIYTRDPRQIEYVEIRFPYLQPGATVEISSLRAEGVYSTDRWDSSRFPLMDEFFQLRNRDWPGKIHSQAELRQSIAVEDKDLGAHNGPPKWDRYGGWSAGPKMRATGHFRVEKYQGKWWFVDPLGNLFWSHGIDSARPSAQTPVTDREHYFAWLPEKSSQFYSEGRGAAREYYKDRSYTLFDVLAQNLERKYQSGWIEVWVKRTHKRLRSWGLNTFGSWADERVYSRSRTPYTVYLHSGGPAIQGAQGYWFNFPDPYDEGFRTGIGRIKSYGQGKIITESMTYEKGRTSDDPWCIGYFVDNEASWGDDLFLATGVVRSPPTQPAKQGFLRELRQRYPGVAELNQAWGTKFKSWEDFLENRDLPSAEASKADLRDFTKKIAARYFSVIRDRIREVAPNKLYLGARFGLPAYPDISRREEWLLPIAAEFCDVVSFNRYRYTTRELQLPQGLDRPIIIGEFHIGALDRGMLHPGLVSAYDQKERAVLYEHYVKQALQNPFIIGTHWFLLNDEPTTGRRDGENYQIGFLDVCDNPYPEIIAASRSIGSQLYQLRSGR
jgi:hypothetical protein